MQKRNVLNSPRLLELKRHRRRVVFKKILLYLLGLTVIFVLLIYLSRLNSLNISKVEILGNRMLETEAVKKTVADQVAGYYFRFFPKTNIFFYPQDAIKNELQNKFKRLNDINLSIKDNNVLEVFLTERTAKYLWCGPDLGAELLNKLRSSAATEPCYFMDENGYIFDEAPYFSGTVYFKFFGAPSAESYFFKQDFKQLTAFKDVLLDLGLKPMALYVTNDGDVEIFLSKGSSSLFTTEPKIIFKLGTDFQNVIENLETALNTEPLKSKFKNKYSSLEYIDLRFGNKVYDKFLETP
jgi:hypothetical protein